MKKIWILSYLLLSVALWAAPAKTTWESMEELSKEAQAGRAAAQAELGRHYFALGEYAEAWTWFSKAARKGNGEGLFGVGYCYETGVCGVEANLPQAISYYKKAVAKKNANGLYRMALLLHDGAPGVKTNPQKALRYMEQSAERGSPQAQTFLAEAYFTGEQAGIGQDYEKARFYWEKLERKGDLKARFNLANLYYHGHGVHKDLRRAFELDMSAAQEGFAPAQYQVAENFMYGEGVEIDAVASMQWLEKAAAQGYEPAMKALETADYYVYKGPDVGYKSNGRVTGLAELRKEAKAGDEAARKLHNSLCEQLRRTKDSDCELIP